MTFTWPNGAAAFGAVVVTGGHARFTETLEEVGDRFVLTFDHVLMPKLRRMGSPSRAGKAPAVRLETDE